MYYRTIHDATLGPITLCTLREQLQYLGFGTGRPTSEYMPAPHGVSPLLDKAVRQLEAYLAGSLRVFDLPLTLEGTSFQKSVWQALCTIPYGETRSYGDIAAQIGNPKASRAVGGANNKNSIAVVIPCHRVIGATGNLVGYAGGLNIKQYLLDLESRHKGA